MMWESHNGRALMMVQGSVPERSPRDNTMVEHVASQLPELCSAGLDAGAFDANSYTLGGALGAYGNDNQPFGTPFPWIDEQWMEDISHARPDPTGQSLPPELNTTPTQTPGKDVAKPRKLVVLKYRQSPRSPGLYSFQGSPGRGEGRGRSGGIHRHKSSLEVLNLFFYTDVSLALILSAHKCKIDFSTRHFMVFYPAGGQV